MVKSNDHKLWKLEMMAKACKILLEPKEKSFSDIIPTKERTQKVVVKTSSSSSKPIPKWLMKVMGKKENVYNPKLIIRKTLRASDLNNGQSRLLLPLKQVLNNNFLTKEERMIHKQSTMKTNKEGVRVVLVDPKFKKHEIDLRMWKVGESSSYVLVNSWNLVVANNEFEVDHVTDIWSFRYGDGKLCLAMSPLYV